MEDTDRAMILRVLRKDVRLKRLYDEHCKLEEKLLSFQGRPFLTNPEEVEAKKLKRKKLAGVDQMMAIVAGERRQAA